MVKLIPATGNNPVQKGGPYFPVDIPPGAAARYPKRRYTYSTITIDLSVARNNEKIKITGNILWAVSAVVASAVLTVKYNEQLGTGLDFRQGMVVSGPEFDQLFVTNAAQVGASITFYYALQDAGNPVFFQNFAASFSTVTISAPPFGAPTYLSNADVNCPNAANTVVRAVNATRITAILSSPPGAGAVRVNSGGGAEGIWLQGGQTLFLDTQAQIQVRNDSGAAILMGVAALLNP
jgi:hypothetical protein